MRRLRSWLRRLFPALACVALLCASSVSEAGCRHKLFHHSARGYHGHRALPRIHVASPAKAPASCACGSVVCPACKTCADGTCKK